MDLKQLNPSKILIINIFGIGDVLFTTPFIQHLKEIFPNASIDYIANRRVAPLLDNYSKINKVHVYERDEWVAVQKESYPAFIKKFNEFVSSIKSEKYDLLFDFSMNQMFSFVSLFAGIKHRIGFNHKNRSPFLTYKYNLKAFDQQHVAQYYLELLNKLGIDAAFRKLEIDLAPNDQQWVEAFFQENGISEQKPVIGIIPGGGSSWGANAHLKRLPAAKYIKLIGKIIENFPAQIILMGDHTEEDLCGSITQKYPDICKAFGKTNLGQFSALLAKCDLVICNDGGPLHMAVAVDTPTISLFGPVDPAIYGPWQVDQTHKVVTKDISCRPCYRYFRMSNCEHLSCLQKLEVDDIWEQVQQKL